MTVMHAPQVTIRTVADTPPTADADPLPRSERVIATNAK